MSGYEATLEVDLRKRLDVPTWELEREIACWAWDRYHEDGLEIIEQKDHPYHSTMRITMRPIRASDV